MDSLQNTTCDSVADPDLALGTRHALHHRTTQADHGCNTTSCSSVAHPELGEGVGVVSQTQGVE